MLYSYQPRRLVPIFTSIFLDGRYVCNDVHKNCKTLEGRVLHQSEFLRRCTICSFLIPAILVGGTSAWRIENVRSAKFCMVQGLSFYLGVLAPVSMVLVFNIVVITCSFHTITNTTLASQRVSIRRQCKFIVYLSVLLGFSWLFPFFQAFNIAKGGTLKQLVEGVVAAMTSLQGFFVFVMSVPMRKEVKDTLSKFWKLSCAWRGKRRINVMSWSVQV